MRAIENGRRLVAAVAVAAACVCMAGTGAAGAETPGAALAPTNVAQTWEFELAKKYYAKVDCYFETLERTNAKGPFPYEGIGRTEIDAINDAKRKAQSDAERGWKVKHCHPKKVWKK